MKRQTFIYFSFLISFFLLISLYRNWLDFYYWPFWLGGIVGILLPELDHLVYVFFLNPHEVTSQRVRFLCKNRQFKRCAQLLLSTGQERIGLIFHTILFQAIFMALTFWVMTSSTSLFGKGIVLAFSLHLVIDQIDKKQPKILLVLAVFLMLIFGFLL